MHASDDHGSARASSKRPGTHDRNTVTPGTSPVPAGGLGPAPRRYHATSTLRSWWAAVSGGRFFTWWTAAASLPTALLLLGAYPGVKTVDELPLPVAISALSWLIQAILVLPAVWAERHLRSPGARAGAVLGTVAVVAGIRPVLNETLLQALAPEFVIGSVPTRIATNIIAWTLLLSLVAVAVDAVDSATRVNGRLRDALSTLAGPEAGDGEAMRAARARVIRIVSALRWRAAALADGSIVDFDRVRAFSEEVRERSHELDALAGADGGDDPRTRWSWAILIPPPVGLVGVLFVIVSVPYGTRVMSIADMAGIAAIVIALAVLGDLLIRRLARGRSLRARGILVLSISIAVGVAVSIVLLLLLSNVVALVALLAIPSLTVLIAIALGAARRGALEQQWLTQALAAYRGVATTAPQTPSDLLRAAASVLHGEVQGRCVVFAASLEDDPATPSQTAQFVAAVSRALDHAVVPQTTSDDEDPFAALIAAWGQVLRIDCAIDDASAVSLRDRRCAREVADIVSEAFVNAVKHSAARCANVKLSSGGASPHPTIRVEVAAPGRLRDARAVPGRGLSELPGNPRLSQRGGDVVLTAVLPRTLP